MTFVFWNLNAEVFTQPTTECFKKVRNCFVLILHQAMYQSIKKHFKLSNYLIQDFQVQKEKYSCFRKCDDEKNLHPGGHNFFFFNRFCGDILFYYLVSFAFFVFL